MFVRDLFFISLLMLQKKKVMKTDGKFSVNNPKLGSTKKRKQENVAEFAKVGLYYLFL